MKIAILSDRIPPEHAGGAEVVAWSLARGLFQAGHQVTVITTTPGPAFEAEREGIPTVHLHAPRCPDRLQAWVMLYNPLTAAPLRAALGRLRPDVVNVHNVHTFLSYHSLTAAHRLNIPAVFSSHDVMPFAYAKLTHFVPARGCAVQPQDYRLPRFYNLRQMRLRYNPLRNPRLRHVLARHAAARTCVSEAHRQALEANGLPPFQVIYNGVDPACFEADPAAVAALRSRLGLEGRRVILFAGRLTREKGSIQLLTALQTVIADVPEALLLTLSRAELPELALPAFAPLRDRFVRAGGWLSGADLAAAFALADVVASPSVCFESLLVINLEAMAAGRPVVTTCFGGAPEAVVDGETGFVVNPLETDHLADRLIRLLRDDDLRARLGAAGQARLRSHFTLDRQVAAMENLLRRVAAAKAD